MDAEVTRLCARFGASYRNNYGWACPLFPANPSPNFSQLEQVANLTMYVRTTRWQATTYMPRQRVRRSELACCLEVRAKLLLADQATPD